MNWYVAAIDSGRSKLAMRSLNLARVPFSYPEIISDQGNRIAVLPGYIFVRSIDDEHQFGMIAACLGIDHLLPAKSEWPVPVREQAMQAFLDQAEIFSTPPMVEAAPVLDRPQLPWFSKDEILSINSGPWVGHTGTFVRVKEGTVELKMQLFNRDINVWFEGRQIEQRM